MIPVTKPFLPPIKDYQHLLEGIWERAWLTNMGPLANQLEKELESYLNVSNLLFVTNGTIALQMAIKALDLKGEIITTPFSFVATTSTIVWENCTPVFVDIDEQSLNIDASKIEAAITDKTTAILATHVYGNPCDVYKIQEIADKYNLKVIYDGAHAFGVKVNEKSIFEFGDISTCSLHATKLYHSVEGGFVISNNQELSDKIESIRNFGFATHVSFSELGINGKNSEFHAAMGLVNIDWIETINQKRKLLADRYKNALRDAKIIYPVWHQNSKNNHAYFPILFDSEQELLRCMKHLESQEVYTRRYFYPSLGTSLPYVAKQDLPITDSIAKRVLCLPLYYDLEERQVDFICKLIIESQSV